MDDDFIKKEEDSDLLDSKDIDDALESEKDQKDFEKEIKDYPVLGEDKSIFEMTRKKRFNNFLGSLFSFFSYLNPLIFFEMLKNLVTKRKKEDKGKDEEFILEGFEGVYYSESKKISKQNLMAYLGFFLIGLFLVTIFFFAGQFLIGVFSSYDQDVCPFDCCINSTFPDKLCPGFATCQNNRCILPECPEHYECCRGYLYNEKVCENEFFECSIDFKCVQKECPYACCTRNDPYKEKECLNGGNCINNECFLNPCPYECCVDEIDYDNKLCDDSHICVDNSCKSKFIEIVKSVFSVIVRSFRFILM